METKSEICVEPLLDELENAFNISFNHTWFRVIADDAEIDGSLLREVEEFFILKTPFASDEIRILEILLVIDEIIGNVRRYLLPTLRDKLRISGFFADDDIIDKDLRVKYRLIAYAFPRNLERLEEIAFRVRSVL
jgi:hypothetical protein